ncbi:hypothetical protein P3L10_021478 [Capsicum annuum]
MKSKMLKETFFFMAITTIMFSFPFSVYADEKNEYHQCVAECSSTCFADIAGCYEHCSQDCKHPNFYASKFWMHCQFKVCEKVKDKEWMKICLKRCGNLAPAP